MTAKTSHAKTLKLVEIGLLTAIVVVLQLFGGYLHIGPVPISLVLIPITLGGVILGPATAAFLGFVFGAVALIAGLTGADSFTAFLLHSQPVMTVILCLVKGTAAGLASAWVYRLLCKKNRWLAILLAAAVTPIVNSGIFVLGALTLMGGTFQTIGEGSGFDSAVVFVLSGIIAVNFPPELIVNLVASPAIMRVDYVVNKNKTSKQ